jgi:site-specific recombinase XerD
MPVYPGPPKSIGRVTLTSASRVQQSNDAQLSANAMAKAGIERKVARSYGFHLFRHSDGSQMQEVTGDLKQTQSFLGHASIGITSDVYVHLQPDSEVKSMKKLEETFFSELCSTGLKTRVEGQEGMVN